MARTPLHFESIIAGEYPKRFNKRELKIIESILEDENINDDFKQAVLVSNTNNVDGTLLTGATAEVAGMHSGKHAYEVYMSAVSSENQAAVQAVYSLTCRADSADDLDGTWFALYTPTAPIVFWYDVDDDGASVPAHGIAGAVEVEITGVATNDTAATVASVTEAVIETNGFSSSAASEVITITCDEAGYTLGVDAGDAAHTDLSVTTEGENEVEGGALKLPYQSADGLELAPLAAADALEISNGVTAISKSAYTVGSFPEDKSIFCEVTMKIDDISDVTEAFFGFRKAEAYQADPEDYDEMASLNIDTDADINVATILNDAATSVTDSTSNFPEGDDGTLRIEVDNDGVCSFLIDGVETNVASFSFDSGEVIVPFLHVNTEVGDPGLSISSWKCGIK